MGLLGVGLNPDLPRTVVAVAVVDDVVDPWSCVPLNPRHPWLEVVLEVKYYVAVAVVVAVVVVDVVV